MYGTWLETPLSRVWEERQSQEKGEIVLVFSDS